MIYQNIHTHLWNMYLEPFHHIIGEKKFKNFTKFSLENELLEHGSISTLISRDFFKNIRNNHEILDCMKQWLFLAVGFSRKFMNLVWINGQDLHIQRYR